MIDNLVTNHNFIIKTISIGGKTIERVVAYKQLWVYIIIILIKCTHNVNYIIKKANNRLCSLRVLKQCGAPSASFS